MPRGYWCILVAVAGLITAPLQAQQASDAGSRQHSTDDGSSGASKPPTQVAPAIDRVADELAKTRKDQADPYGDERNKRERRDIVAQEDAAYWGRANFLAMVVQTILAAGALWAIVADLRQSRSSSETQTRAFVTVHDISYRRDHPQLPRYNLELNIENQGSTPAYIKRVFFIVGWRRPGVAEEIIDKISEWHRDTSFIVAAGAQFCVTAPMPASFAISDMGGSTLRIYGAIEYLDIFDKRRTTNFKFYSTAKEYISREDALVARTSMDGNTGD